MYLTLLICTLLITLCNAVGNRDCSCEKQIIYNVCEESVSSSSQPIVAQGPPGKKGPQGVKGERGPRGLPGVVDYERIESHIAESMETVQSKFESRIEKLEEILSNITAVGNDIKNNVNLTEKCKDDNKVMYGGRCYFVVIKNMNALVANDTCKSKGSQMANIYSREHYDFVISYIRRSFDNAYVGIWLGMTYDTTNRKVLLSNGSDAPYVIWNIRYPSRSRSYSQMGILVMKDASERNQNMFNHPGTSVFHGVLCEIDIA